MTASLESSPWGREERSGQRLGGGGRSSAWGCGGLGPAETVPNPASPAGQFVPFRDYVDRTGNHVLSMARLARDVLAEIPDQLVSYMKAKGIRPRPAPEAPASSPAQSPAHTPPASPSPSPVHTHI